MSIALSVVRDALAECRGCGFRHEHSPPVAPWGDGSLGLALVGETVGDDEVLLGRPFEERPGLVLKKNLLAAGVDPRRCLLTNATRCAVPADRAWGVAGGPCRGWLAREFDAAGTRVAVALGRTAVRLLLDLPAAFRLQDYAGVPRPSVYYPGVLVFPWHSAAAVMAGGRAADAKTVALFRTAKESACSPA